MRRRRLPVVCVLMVALFACGGDSPTIPSAGTFPVAQSGCGPYYIQGLASAVVDPAASSLEAQLQVGDKVQIALAWCSSWGGPFEFRITDPEVLSFQQGILYGGVGAPSGELRANRVGQTTIALDFKADDGKRYRTTLGYCPGDDFSYCVTPRPIDLITVVAR